MSTRAPGSRATCHFTDFNETLPVYRVYPKIIKDELVSVFVFSRGEIDPSPVFLDFHRGNRFIIGKMYEALTAMVFNQLF